MEETTRESFFSPPNLPHEMMEEILLRLPVKSLMRFKCVCISWRSLISEPLFTLRHASILEASKATTYKKSPYGVITTSRYHLKSCCVHSLYNESMVNVLEHDGELLGRDYYQVVGTCHGLICFHVDYNKSLYLWLWNPTIKLQQRLSGSDLETRDDDVVMYGFGYDESEDDYKVVALLQQRHQLKTEAKIYSTRRKVWRNSCFPSGVVVADKSRSGIYINGALNWPATSLLSSSSWTIISYDMSRDMFRELPGPVCCKRGCFTLTLGDLRGCLSMVCYCKGANADIWVMNEFGEGESWSKLLNIPGLTEFVRPLWISNDLVVLLEFRSGLALYNSASRKFRYPVSDSLSSCRDAKVFVKTMVSPNNL